MRMRRGITALALAGGLALAAGCGGDSGLTDAQRSTLLTFSSDAAIACQGDVAVNVYDTLPGALEAVRADPDGTVDDTGITARELMAAAATDLDECDTAAAQDIRTTLDSQ